MQSTINQISETVKPVLTKAVDKTTPVITSAIESTIKLVERIDPEATQRDSYFTAASASAEVAADADAAPAQEEKKDGVAATQAEQEPAVVDPLQKLKVVTGDLLDLWLYEGSKGVSFVQESKAYKLTDPYVHYVDKFEAVKSRSAEVLHQVHDKVVLFYDDATKFVGMLIRVLTERQDELVAYVRSTYSNVQVFVQDNYLRLDFNEDGTVGMDDLRQSLQQFYDFLKNYDYIEATSRIKSSIYDQAQSLLKRDREEAQSRSQQAAVAAEGGEGEGVQSAQNEQEVVETSSAPQSEQITTALIDDVDAKKQ